MKLIKLSDSHYVVVDDSEIGIGDWLKYLHISFPVQFIRRDDDAIMISTPNHDTCSRVSPVFCKKITHSFGKELEGVINKPLSEVGEAVYGYSVEKMAIQALKSQWSHLFINNEFPKKPYPSFFQVGLERWIEGFKAHQELVKDKLFTIEDMAKFLDYVFTCYPNQWKVYRAKDNRGFYTSEELVTQFIQSLLPKTEWDVIFDEQGKITILNKE